MKINLLKYASLASLLAVFSANVAAAENTSAHANPVEPDQAVTAIEGAFGVTQ